jgi:hypothetical protein
MEQANFGSKKGENKPSESKNGHKHTDFLAQISFFENKTLPNIT